MEKVRKKLEKENEEKQDVNELWNTLRKVIMDTAIEVWGMCKTDTCFKAIKC